MSSNKEGMTARNIFIEGGEIGSLMRSLDWSQTPLGDVANWPQSLRSAISILLPSKAQICLFWRTSCDWTLTRLDKIRGRGQFLLDKRYKSSRIVVFIEPLHLFITMPSVS